MRVQGGFRAGLDLDGGANLVAFGRRDFGIPEQEGLTVLIFRISFQPESLFGNRSGCDFGELGSQRPGDVASAGIADSVEPGAAFFATEPL